MAAYSDGSVVIEISADAKEFKDKLDNINEQINVFGKQAKEVETAIQQAANAGASTAELQATKYQILKQQIEEVGVKLNLLNELNKESTEIGGEKGSEEWINRQIAIANTTAELQRLNDEMTNNSEMIQQQIKDNEALGDEMTAAYESGKISANLYAERCETIANNVDELEKSLERLNAENTTQSTIYSNLAKRMESYDNSIADSKTRLTDINSALQTAKQGFSGVSSVMQLNEQRSNALNTIYGQLESKCNDLRNEAEAMRQALSDGSISQEEYEDFNRTLTETEQEMRKVKAEVGEYSENAEDAGNKTVTFGELLKANIASEAIVTTVKKLASAMGDLAKAVTTEALQAYASYEQSIGGIETLFGDSADTIIANAQNAYQTAQVSANTYMEMVTSFSATLLQGLGNDTAKAAEVADLALVDMADNANKMGTSLSSIQYAYQGFARDSYVMLDNLKLGYGGSATEMARLINDSGVLNGELEATAENVKDIPFDKVIEAIHTIQENLGITGTTAEEAETTLEGSVNKLKASWENALVEIAEPLDEFAQGSLNLLNDNVDTVKDTLVELMEQLKPVIDELLGDVQEWIDNGGLQELSDNIVELVTFIIDNKETVLGVITGVMGLASADKISGIVSGLTSEPQAVTNITTAVSKLGVALTSTSGVIGGLLLVGGVLIGKALEFQAAVENGEYLIGDHSEKVQELDGEYETLCGTLEEFKKLQEENAELAGQQANENIDSAKQQQKSYKDQITQLENLIETNRKYNGGQLELGEQLYYYDNSGNRQSSTGQTYGELMDELGSLYNDYYKVTEIVDTYSDTMAETAKNNVKHMGEVEEAAANSIKNLDKTTEEVLSDIKSRKAEEYETKLQEQVDELNKLLAIHQIEEDEYYQQLSEALTGSKGWLYDNSELWHKYNDELTEYQNSQLEEEKAEVEETQEDIREITQKALEERLEAYKDTAKEELTELKSNLNSLVSMYKSKYNDVVKLRDSYKNKLMGDSIFTVTTETDEKTNEEITTYAIENINEILAVREHYADEIQKLQDRGLADGLMEELESLDDEAATVFAEKLNGMSDDEFNEINERYKNLDEKTTELANTRYANQLESLQTEFIDKYQAEFDNLSPALQNAGANALQSFIDGFNMDSEDAFTNLSDSISNMASTITDNIEATTVDMTGTIETAVANGQIGQTMADNILAALEDNKDDIQTKLEEIFSSTGLDLVIKSDVASSTAAQSQGGYVVAANTTAAANDTAQSVVYTQAATNKIAVEVTGKITDKGGRVIADIVNKANSEKSKQGGT